MRWANARLITKPRPTKPAASRIVTSHCRLSIQLSPEKNHQTACALAKEQMIETSVTIDPSTRRAHWRCTFMCCIAFLLSAPGSPQQENRAPIVRRDSSDTLTSKEWERSQTLSHAVYRPSDGP